MRCILAALIVLILGTTVLMSATAHAETWTVGSIGSYHFQRDKKYCEFNPGLGIEHVLEENTRFVAGQYSNSFCRSSAYVGGSYTPLSVGPFKLGIALIAVTGYEKTDKKHEKQPILIAPLGVISFERSGRGFNFIIAPPDGNDFTGAIGFQVKFRF